VTGRHRLTVHADLLPQAPGDAGLRIGEVNALRENAAVPTDEAPLRVHERNVVRGPWQIIPCPIPTRSHSAGVSTTAAAGVAARTTPLNSNYQAAAHSLVHRHDPKSRQTKNPRAIAP